MSNNGAVFQSQFASFGNLRVEFVKEVITTRIATYFYNCVNMKQYSRRLVEKILEKMSAFNGFRISFVPTYESHFAISLELKHKQTLYITTLPKGAIGQEDNGKPFSFNFNEVKHILVAGTTGAGKSVFLNSLLYSLYQQTRGAFNCYIIDNKRVTFTEWSANPNIKIISETDEAIHLFDTLIALMENRYKDMANGKKDFLPIYVIVDELADLMLASRYECEDSLVRLAQKSRQANIHLILATQRPTVNVVSGLIKAQCDTRVCFKMASSRDSVTILDHKGGEDLLGYGDCYIKLPTSINEKRVQIAYYK